MAVHQEPQVFLYLSELLGRKITDSEGRPVGKILDLTGNIGEIYPPVTEVLLRSAVDGKMVLFPWRSLVEVNDMLVSHPVQPGDFRTPVLRSGELLLKDTLLDKQVVDTDGAKIRRVNDLQFLKTHKTLYLVHVDVGFHGLLRRVGLERPIHFLFRLLLTIP